MVESASQPPHREFSETDIEYRAVDPWAVAGLILGLLSPLALLDTPWWLFCLFGIAVNAIALRRIRADACRSGRPVALVGLALSMMFLAAPIAQTVVSMSILGPQGRPIVEQWFEYLREENPARALQLTFVPEQRDATDDVMWFNYRNDRDSRKSLEMFVSRPLVRTLLALGKQAEIRHYDTQAMLIDRGTVRVAYLYTVTFDVGEGKQTFFVRVVAKRQPAREGLNPWQIDNFEGPVEPSGKTLADANKRSR